MSRVLLEELLLFSLPFLVFALYLVLRRRHPLRPAHWSGRIPTLALGGLALVIASLVYAGLTARREAGGFVPTHMENGRLVPGTFGGANP